MENKELLKVLDGLLGVIVLSVIGLVFMIIDGKLWGKHGTKTNHVF